MPYWDHGQAGGGWLMLLGMLIFWAGLITVVVLVLRRFAHASPRHGGWAGGDQGGGAYHVLDDRFARGEIDRDEYESRRATLRESHGRSESGR
ncbi:MULTISPECIES: SHOCT domain-containing protein [Actinoalloteichus]|uniref:Short C-terminal domain n=1 Tax=Actinoalloteichus fjordicus TaxID=1612552 RepID=A0AAC9PT16_9PSEU|nr:MULTISPECIES: SHOCT domain-containing protein [Actinoalloteichus]APU15620.1 Short C-terminal domain [Actinoalloteichus fjordicus]APU21680.1 Short C-terminal domain [Actinoalloteichus sp. GBA129-24]